MSTAASESVNQGETGRAPARTRYMRPRSRWIAAGGALLGGAAALVALFVGLRATEAAPVRAVPVGRDGDVPVLVELFTSEGCSSCPPADDALRELARAQGVPGAWVVVLEEHVDYWNDLGWPDPFSSPDVTARQRAYMHLGGRLYTPQAIVDGSAQLVGSRGGAIEKAIAAATHRPHGRLEIELATAQARGVLDVGIKVTSLPEGAVDPELLVALVQDRASIAVARGENAGKTLEHVAIARSLKTLGAAAAGTTSRALLQLPAPVGAPKATFSLVAFVQERSSRRVLGSAATALRALDGG